MLDKPDPRSLASLAVADVTSCVLVSLNVCFPTCSPFPIYSPCPSAAAPICPDLYTPPTYPSKEMKCLARIATAELPDTIQVSLPAIKPTR